MFHQVSITPQHYHALRFLWWSNDDLTEEPVDFQILVHFIGETSSLSCGSFSVEKTASENECGFDVETINTLKTLVAWLIK